MGVGEMEWWDGCWRYGVVGWVLEIWSGGMGVGEMEWWDGCW